jgi:hypothetical protein
LLELLRNGSQHKSAMKDCDAEKNRREDELNPIGDLAIQCTNETLDKEHAAEEGHQQGKRHLPESDFFWRAREHDE